MDGRARGPAAFWEQAALCWSSLSLWTHCPRDLWTHSALVVSLEMSALPRELTLVTLTSGETALPRVLGPVTGVTGQGRMVSDVAWCVSGGTLGANCGMARALCQSPVRFLVCVPWVCVHVSYVKCALLCVLVFAWWFVGAAGVL